MSAQPSACFCIGGYTCWRCDSARRAALALATHEHSPALTLGNPAASVSNEATRAAHEAEALPGSGINSVARGAVAPRVVPPLIYIRVVPPLIYIAGPYRASSAWQVEQNIRCAEDYGYQIAKLGGYPVIPHANTRYYFEGAQSDPNFWLDGTLEMMRGCRALFMLPQWPMSSGARVEHLEAQQLGKPIFEDLSACGEWIRAFVKQRAEVSL